MKSYEQVETNKISLGVLKCLEISVPQGAQESVYRKSICNNCYSLVLNNCIKT